MDKREIAGCLDKRIHEINEHVVTDWTVYNKRQSDWSRQIQCYEHKNPADTLKEVFCFSCSNWEEKFKEATTGKGQEISRIMTLHSSALLALLCFAGVSEENPLRINGEEYIESHFEVQNKVYSTPSNIDVVLIAKSGNRLFLESKFTEYLESDTPRIKMAYLNFYQNLLPLIPHTPLEMIHPYLWKEKGEQITGFTIKPKSGKKEYLGGIKQCLSHIIGISKGPANPDSECWRGVDENKDIKLTFGTILYKLPCPQFTSYKQLYSETIGVLKPDHIVKSFEDKPAPFASHLNILPEVLTYQDVFVENRNFLPTSIKKFYNL